MVLSRFAYDAFISHAIEDKGSIANSLVAELQKRGIKVWYSGKDLKPGESIAAVIHKAIRDSRFGVVILSPQFVSKDWTVKELNILLSMETMSRKIVIPILFNITPQEVSTLDPMLADRYAIKADKGIDFIANELTGIIRRKRKKRIFGRLALITISTIALFFGLRPFVNFSEIQSPQTAQKINEQTITPGDVKKAIDHRIKILNDEIKDQLQSSLVTPGGATAAEEQITSIWLEFSNLKTHFRNEYEFRNGYSFVKARKNVETVLHSDPAKFSPGNRYEMELSPNIMLMDNRKSQMGLVKYSYLAPSAIRFKTAAPQLQPDGSMSVDINYENNIRYIEVSLTFVIQPKEIKRHLMKIWGFLPSERFVFKQDRGGWILDHIE